ncbi:AtzH-like domain-containing protein [Actinomycetes bacterium KLBMP 9797]
MYVDEAEVVAEVAAAFAAYEQALMDGDVTAMTEAFWADERVVRFGLDDRQSGATALREWRAGQPPLPPGRRLLDTRITTFGTDFAVVTTRFTYPDDPVEGRQSQTWARFGRSWRIVSAHVSHPRTARIASGR